MKLNYRTVVTLLGVIIATSLIQLAFFAIPEKPKLALSAREIRQDLYVLLDQVEQHSAFYALDNRNHDELNRLAGLISSQYQNQISKERFAAELTKLLNTMKDPGTQISQAEDSRAELPLTLRPMNEQWLALDKQNQPIDPNFPFLTHIDGIPLSKWIAVSQAYLSQPAKDSQEMQSLWLKRLNLLREDLGLSLKPYVVISLINDAQLTTQVTLPLQSEAKIAPAPLDEEFEFSLSSLVAALDNLAPIFSPRPRYELEAINDTSVVLKIDDLHAFESDKVQQQLIRQGMKQDLLVIDLRHAKGFSPKLLNMLSRYQDVPLDTLNSLTTPTEQIMAYAHYRRAPGLRNDYLRPLNFQPLNTLNLSSPRQKMLIRRLPSTDENKFSPWFVRTKVDVQPEGQNRLALLVSPYCRQECEWIAYRTKAWSRVNLIGEKTSGDFARHYHFTLPNSGLNIRFSSSLTYDNRGQLLSGIGTEPDILLPQNSDLEWHGLVSLVNSAQTKPISLSANLQPKLVQIEPNSPPFQPK